MNQIGRIQLKEKQGAERQQTLQSRAFTTLRKEISLPSFSSHLNPKQLYPCKSWNQLARETEEKKQKRKLNNQLKTELQRFFQRDEIAASPSKGSAAKNQRSNKRTPTQKNQPKPSTNRKSFESLTRQPKPPPIKIQAKQTNFVPRKGGLKPPRFLADLEIEDSSSEAFRSIVPQSPMTPISPQRSTPRQTPRSHIVPSRLNSNRCSESNRQGVLNKYTEPDSPVDALLRLRSESSQHNPYQQQDLYNERARIQSIKHPQHLKQIKIAEQVWQETGALATRFGEFDVYKDDEMLNKEPHLKNLEMLKQMQRRLGSERAAPYEDLNYHQNNQQSMPQDPNSIEYLRRPNQLQIIDEVEDDKSFNWMPKDSEDGRSRHVPLSIVQERPDSDVDERKLSKQMIRQCSSKQLLKNTDFKPQLESNGQNSPFLTQSFKKKATHTPLEVSHSSMRCKNDDLHGPSGQIPTTFLQKPRGESHEDIEMSPIERSKLSGLAPDQVDNSISKEFGSDWFTPTHEKKSQSIEKISPIYDYPSSNTWKADERYKYKYGNPSAMYQNAGSMYSANLPKYDFASRHLMIRYPQSNNNLDKNQQHTLKVYRKSHNFPPSASVQLDLKSFNYNHSQNLNSSPNVNTLQINNTSNSISPLMTEPPLSYKRDSVSDSIKEEPVGQMSRKFNLHLKELNFLPKVGLSTTPLNDRLIQENREIRNSQYLLSQRFNRTFEPRMTNFTPTISPLNSHRPSGRIELTTQRNSTSLTKRKGIKVWTNNCNQNEGRQESLVKGKLKSTNQKRSLERMSDLYKGIFSSRSKSRPRNITISSPVQNYVQKNTNTEPVICQPSSTRKNPSSPSKNLIRLGRRASITQQSPRVQSPRKPGIKLACEFRRHKYQQKGVVRYLS